MKVFWHVKFMQKDEDLDVNGAAHKLMFGEIAIKNEKMRQAFWKKCNNQVPKTVGKKCSAVTNDAKKKFKGKQVKN